MWLVVAVLSLLGATLPGEVFGGYYGDYHCVGGRDVFVHLFEWKWTDVAQECEEYLGGHGYCAVQVSPPNEHRIVVGDEGYKNYPWWQRYQPVSYKMGSRSGTESEFKNMVQRCNDAGVRVYTEAVINHMTGGGSGHGSDGSFFNADNEDFPGVPFTAWDFHGSDVCYTWDLNIHDYNNAQEVRHCRLNGLRDLRHGKEYVREKIAGYLNKLVDWGVAGFRIDAAKHMLPNEMMNIFDRLHDLNTRWFPSGVRPFIYQEVINLGDGGAIKNTAYTPIGRVTEFKYGINLGDVIRKNYDQKLKYLGNFGEGWGFMSGMSSIAFVDNHDNQRGHGAGSFSRILTFFEAKMYKMANAFQLAWPYGYIRLMSSYSWPRNIQNGRDVNDWVGPPSWDGGRTKDVSCFGEWICEHRWRQISNMVRFHNVAIYTTVENWWDNENNAIAFSRGDKGFIVINNEDYSISQRFTVGLPDGEYCDVISCDNNRPPCGECHAPIRVQNGQADITVPNNDDPIIAIHV